MFDTNVFNAIAKGEIPMPSAAHLDVRATHVQLAELERTSEPNLRQKLIAAFNAVSAKLEPMSAMVWGEMKWGQARWSDGVAYNAIRQDIAASDKERHKKTSPQNQARDALIVLTALDQNCILVSDDKGARDVMRARGGSSVTSGEFAEMVRS